MFLKRKFLEGKKTSLPECILICCAAALTGTFLHYEHHFENRVPVHTALTLTVTVLTVLIWSYCAAECGRDGRFGFLIFSLLYFGIPYIYLLFYDARDNVRHYSKYLAFFGKISSGTLKAPFEDIAGIIGIPAETAAFVLCILCGLMYGAGALAKRFINDTDKRKE